MIKHLTKLLPKKTKQINSTPDKVFRKREERSMTFYICSLKLFNECKVINP